MLPLLIPIVALLFSRTPKRFALGCKCSSNQGPRPQASLGVLRTVGYCLELKTVCAHRLSLCYPFVFLVTFTDCTKRCAIVVAFVVWAINHFVSLRNPQRVPMTTTIHTYCRMASPFWSQNGNENVLPNGFAIRWACRHFRFDKCHKTFCQTILPSCA